MVARAIYRAALRVGGERVGVKIYSAVTEKGVHFHLLHEPDSVRVRQRMVNPNTDETVESEDVVRAVEVERGTFVRLSDEELERFRPEPSRDIEVTALAEPEDLDQRLYERPYLLGPDGAQAQRYFALAKALEESGKQGIARWTMRNRRYNGALRLEGKHLALVTLRDAADLVPLEQLRVTGQRELEKRELDLARQLVSALAGPFDPAEYHDEYRERVLEFLSQKSHGKHVRLRRFTPKKVPDDALVAALERSIKKAG